MRLFVAIEIAPEIRERIVDFIEQIKPHLGSARWSSPEGLHITLKFLGNVPDEKKHAIEECLTSVKNSRFSLNVAEIGLFPNSKSPRVLWVGVDPQKELAALAGQVDAAMEPLGFEREKRAYSPHITLMRFNERTSKVNLSSVLSSVPKAGFGTMTANEFHLYESKLSPQGSRYIKLASFPLS